MTIRRKQIFTVLVLIISLLLVWLCPAAPRERVRAPIVQAGRVTSASVEQEDVQAAVNAAKDGDTVIIPAGTASWTTRMTVSKGITIQGATTVDGAGTQNCTANDRTILLDDSPRNTRQSGLIQASLNPRQRYRLTGITFKAGSSAVLNDTGVVMMNSSGNAPNKTMRVDHCHFDHVYSRMIKTGGYACGVADHNLMEAERNSQAFFANMPHWRGTNNTLGDESWADFTYYGTDNFFFFEDNTIIGNGKVPTSGSSDAEFGARFVSRYNDWTNAREGWHGTEGTSRGTRAVEVYNNHYHWSITPSSMNRSGTCMYHDNTWDGLRPPRDAHSNLVQYREMGASGKNGGTYGSSDGTSIWDENDTDGKGHYQDGQPGFLFESGSCNALVSSNGVMTDTTKNWATDTWKGYSITNGNPNINKGSHITKNTNNAITYAFYGDRDRGPLMTFNSGDRYQIHRVLSSMDQPGRGKSDLLTGDSMHRRNTKAGKPMWPHNQLEPCMSWNNVYTPKNISIGFFSGYPTETQGKDYHNLGLGFNTTPDKVMQTYTAAVNGVDYKEPFQHPHPFTSVGRPVPSPTASATAAAIQVPMQTPTATSKR